MKIRSIPLVLLFALAALVVFLPGPAQAASRPSCNHPAPGEVACFSSWTPLSPSAGFTAAGAPRVGLTPADLLAAYGLPKKGGQGITIGIVVARDYPKAESDLAVYRKTFRLGACTTANGCFRKVNQRGGHKYPRVDEGWATEAALDIQSVSAFG